MILYTYKHITAYSPHTVSFEECQRRTFPPIFHLTKKHSNMETTSIKRLKIQNIIKCLLPLLDGVHALATVLCSDQIWKVNLETGEMKICCGGEEGKDDGKPDTVTFNGPWGLAMKSNGSVVVADTCNNLIREISPCGK